MKKILSVIFALFAISSLTFAVPTAFNETHPENWSNLSYYTVPIYKILDSSDAYVVVYAKNKVGVGECVIPKAWLKSSKDNPRKLQINFLPAGKLKSHLTYIKKEGNFLKVVLNVPENKRNSVWGVVEPGKTIPGVDKETLEDLPL